MRTFVYIDGFNLYYGCLRRQPAYRWLDLATLSRKLLPGDSIDHIRYFTAHVQMRGDPQAQQRQRLYLRALRTISNLDIHFGRFTSHVERMPLAHPIPGQPKTVEVLYTEEKGSDVNLATYLVADAFRGRFEQALVISNDSDLEAPIALVRAELGLPVIVANPHRHPAAQLQKSATRCLPILPGALANSQFVPTLMDSGGTFARPPTWR